MISRDVKALDSSSAVYARLKEYSSLFEELNVVVMARSPKNIKSLNTERLYIYNATSQSKIVSFFKTFFIARKLARKNNGKDTWVTSQDPFESGLVAFIIAKLTRIKLQLQLHTDCFNLLYIKHNFANYFRTLIARFIVTRADSIRVVSERIKSSLLTFDFRLSTKISVLPIWTDISHIQQSEVSEKFDLKKKFPEFGKIILIVARLEKEKNIELSLISFKKMLRFDNTLGLVIAGSGREEEWLKNLAKSLGIGNNVRFIGWVSDTTSLFKTADLLLVTSFYEGYGLGIIEAVACGCPVVSTDVGIAKEAGATIVPYDAGQIALNVIEVLNQKERKILKDKFNISKSDYLDLFKKLFNNV